MPAREILNRLFLAALAVVLALPLLLSPGYFGAGSETENRRLAPAPGWPAFDTVSDWPERLRDYVSDHYPLRAWMIQSAARLRFALHMEPGDRAVIGRDGWLFLSRKNALNQARGADPLSDRELASLHDYFQGEQDFWQSRGVQWLHVLAPGKGSMLRDQLPARVKIIGPARALQWQATLNASAVNSLDLLPTLQGAESLYYRSDSHWNCRAADLAFAQIMARLAEHDELVMSPRPPIKTSEQAFTGDIARSLFGLGDAMLEVGVPECPMAPAPAIAARDFDTGAVVRDYTPQHPFQQLRTVAVQNPEAPNPQRVAIVRDSFFWPLQPLFNRSFQHVLYVYHWGLAPHRELLERFAPDYIIYQYTDRAMHDWVEARRNEAQP